YWQFGDYGTDAGGGTINQSGAYGLVAGLHYDLPESDETEAPWIDFSIWDISGDDDASDGDNSSFVSYEFNNDTVVLEDAYYGLDIDSNYQAIKIKGGMNLSNEWSVQGLYAYATLNKNRGGAASNPGNSSDKLGDEFDFRAVYRATDYLTFYFNAGLLQNAKALGVGSGIEVVSVTSEVRF
ncbi:MAG: alginate export family protein, partial [Planctomycetota bacterium]